MNTNAHDTLIKNAVYLDYQVFFDNRLVDVQEVFRQHNDGAGEIELLRGGKITESFTKHRQHAIRRNCRTIKFKHDDVRTGNAISTVYIVITVDNKNRTNDWDIFFRR